MISKFKDFCTLRGRMKARCCRELDTVLERMTMAIETVRTVSQNSHLNPYSRVRMYSVTFKLYSLLIYCKEGPRHPESTSQCPVAIRSRLRIQKWVYQALKFGAQFIHCQNLQDHQSGFRTIQKSTQATGFKVPDSTKSTSIIQLKSIAGAGNIQIVSMGLPQNLDSPLWARNHLETGVSELISSAYRKRTKFPTWYLLLC